MHVYSSCPQQPRSTLSHAGAPRQPFSAPPPIRTRPLQHQQAPLQQGNVVLQAGGGMVAQQGVPMEGMAATAVMLPMQQAAALGGGQSYYLPAQQAQQVAPAQFVAGLGGQAAAGGLLIINPQTGQQLAAAPGLLQPAAGGYAQPLAGGLLQQQLGVGGQPGQQVVLVPAGQVMLMSQPQLAAALPMQPGQQQVYYSQGGYMQ